MKLSEINGYDALDAIAEILEPAAEIMTDKKVVGLFRSGKKMKAISAAIKGHKKEVTTILAILDGKNPETYSPNIVEIPVKILSALNDPALQQLFSSQQTAEQTASSAGSTNTEAR